MALKAEIAVELGKWLEVESSLKKEVQKLEADLDTTKEQLATTEQSQDTLVTTLVKEVRKLKADLAISERSRNEEMERGE